MGFETDNSDFRAAAEQAHAVHDGTVADTADAFLKEADAPTLGSTDGSPIGAAAAEVNETATDATAEDAGPTLFQLLMSQFLGQAITAAEAEAVAAAQAAADAESEEIEEDAIDQYEVARKLSAMSTGAESFADQLELNGMGDVAEFVREAAKQVRKGAKLARANARETLTVLDGTDL